MRLTFTDCRTRLEFMLPDSDYEGLEGDFF